MRPTLVDDQLNAGAILQFLDSQPEGSISWVVSVYLGVIDYQYYLRLECMLICKYSFDIYVHILNNNLN
jgi:hypothetical protein